MDTQPAFASEDVIAAIVGDAAQAVSRRAGESALCQDGRACAATDAILGFRPRDAIEAILASHCLMFHELIVADVHRTLCGEDVATQRATRSGIVAMDKAFGANLMRLKQRRTASREETPPADDRTEPEFADRIRRHLSQIEPPATAADPERSDADATTEAWPAAVQMSGLNRQARRALDRQIRKRAPPGLLRQGITPDRNEPTTTTSAKAAG